MTTHTPAPKASSAAALLVSLPTNPPKMPLPATQDFLSVILQALTAKPGNAPSEDERDTAAEKSSSHPSEPSHDAVNPDPAGLLLTLLTQPPPLPQLPALPKVAPHKAPAVSIKGSAAPPPGLNQRQEAASADSKPSALAKVLAPPDENSEPDVPPVPANSGTSVATTGLGMTFEAQRNEVAGSTEQKLPPGDVGAVTAVNAISGQGGAKPSLDFSWRETPPEVVAIVNLSGKPAELADPEPTTAPSAVTQAGRLEQLVSREVVTIHQTGAQTLGVSLKLDENTHIFLQLTTENGQIQASLRCEKGDFSALDSQWTQLQASLARQNVQLVPASGASQSNFQQTSQHQKRELPQGREEWRHPGRVATPAQSRQQKNPNARRSRPDWEFWA